VLELKFRAERLVKAGGTGTREAPLLDAPLGEALFALVARRPRYSPGLEAPREEWGTLAAAAYPPRAFLSEADLARTAAALDQCERLLELARTLGLAVSLPGTPPPRLTAIYLTALANERMGRGFAPAPLAEGELARAVEALTTARTEPVEGRAAIEDPRLEGAPRRRAAPRALALCRGKTQRRFWAMRPRRTHLSPGGPDVSRRRIYSSYVGSTRSYPGPGSACSSASPAFASGGACAWRPRSSRICAATVGSAM